MRYAKGIYTDLKILHLLAIEKEFPQYEMHKRLGLVYRSILRHLQQLENNNLIRVLRTEKSAKRGKERKIYSLTKMGLLAILEYRATYNSIDVIAKNHEEMFPLLFGKWAFFKEQGILSQIIERIKDAVFRLSLGLSYKGWYKTSVESGVPDEMIDTLEKIKGKKEAELFEIGNKKLMGDFTISVFNFDLTSFPPQAENLKDSSDRQKALINTLAKDSELKKLLGKQFNFETESNRKRYQNASKWQEWLENQLT